MSDLDPSRRLPQQPARSFVLPAPPPTDLKPIATWMWVGTIVLILGLAGGSFAFIKWARAQTHTVEAAVAALHKKMIGADDAGIFADADPTYRATITDKTSNDLFDNVRKRLGAPRSSRQTNSNYSNDENMGNFLTIHYFTVFDKGSGKETICLHNLNGVWKLAAYNVESPLLQTNKPPIRVKPKPSL
jgi:hypothetical protein